MVIGFTVDVAGAIFCAVVGDIVSDVVVVFAGVDVAGEGTD